MLSERPPEEGALVSAAELRSLLEDSLPQDEIVYSFAYGSGVLSQETKLDRHSGNGEKKMIDFIIGVRDAERFHRANLDLNPDHYATGPFMLATDRAARITWWQRHAVDNRYFRNPGIYFNVTDENFKYGVVQVDDLSVDLTEWKYLYLAGRMHKPIVVTTTMDSKLQDQQSNSNLPAALSASLLLLKKSVVSDAELYAQIAALSYTGDPRMAAGAEDPEKVNKLVQSPGQMQRFADLYEDSLEDLETQGVLSAMKNGVTWDAANPKAHQLLWEKLPQRLQPESFNTPVTAVQNLERMLPTIVAPAARYQSLKGLATAGFRRSWSYAMRKLSKGVLRR